jgi:hypothetical protein
MLSEYVAGLIRPCQPLTYSNSNCFLSYEIYIFQLSFYSKIATALNYWPVHYDHKYHWPMYWHRHEKLVYEYETLVYTMIYSFDKNRKKVGIDWVNCGGWSITFVEVRTIQRPKFHGNACILQKWCFNRHSLRNRFRLSRSTYHSSYFCVFLGGIFLCPTQRMQLPRLDYSTSIVYNSKETALQRHCKDQINWTICHVQLIWSLQAIAIPIDWFFKCIMRGSFFGYLQNVKNY